MGSVSFKHFNWAVILASFKRSGLTKKQFYLQELAHLYPNQPLPKIGTFYEYLRVQERQSSAKASASDEQESSTVSNHEPDPCAHVAEPEPCAHMAYHSKVQPIALLKVELSKSSSEPMGLPLLLLARMLAPVANVPPWRIGFAALRQRHQDPHKLQQGDYYDDSRRFRHP